MSPVSERPSAGPRDARERIHEKSRDARTGLAHEAEEKFAQEAAAIADDPVKLEAAMMKTQRGFLDKVNEKLIGPHSEDIRSMRGKDIGIVFTDPAAGEKSRKQLDAIIGALSDRIIYGNAHRYLRGENTGRICVYTKIDATQLRDDEKLLGGLIKQCDENGNASKSSDLRRLLGYLREFGSKVDTSAVDLDRMLHQEPDYQTRGISKMLRITGFLAAGAMALITGIMGLANAKARKSLKLTDFTAAGIYAAVAGVIARPDLLPALGSGKESEAILKSIDRTLNNKTFKDTCKEFGIKGKVWKRAMQRLRNETFDLNGASEKKKDAFARKIIPVTSTEAQAAHDSFRRLLDAPVQKYQSVQNVAKTENEQAFQVVLDFVDKGAIDYYHPAPATPVKRG